MEKNTKGLHITLTEEQKRLWDFMLADTQMKAMEQCINNCKKL